jgi:predicted site-specific integrase-resolvase
VAEFQMTMEELLALPVALDLKTAARALGIAKGRAYEMAAAGTFPCPIRRYGNKYRISRASVFRELDLDPTVVGARGESAAGRPPVREQREGLSSDAVRALYDALMAAAQVLVDRNAVP